MAAEPNHFERTVVERRDPLLGQVFDRRFRIEAKIAAGGFGSIYRVTHIRSGHEFALKVLHPNLTSDPRVVTRFQREGEALTRLRDPHTITAYELGEAQGTLYILMELLHGESLYERFRSQGALPWRPVLTLARAVCASLAEAHSLGIIHRDLKPTNIHLEPGEDGVEFVKVLDFGIAKVLTEGEIDNSELTQTGQMIGTLDYMSPEQMVGGQLGPSTDIYTLGVLMYEMIAGRRPFEVSNSATAALAAMLTTTPDRLASRRMVPTDVDRVVMKCLERTHTDRFQSAEALALAIDEVLQSADEPVTTVALGKSAARYAVTLPKSPIRPLEPTPSANPAAPADNQESTLQGHEPVARLPATPLRAPAQASKRAPASKSAPPSVEIRPSYAMAATLPPDRRVSASQDLPAVVLESTLDEQVRALEDTASGTMVHKLDARLLELTDGVPTEDPLDRTQEEESSTAPQPRLERREERARGFIKRRDVPPPGEPRASASNPPSQVFARRTQTPAGGVPVRALTASHEVAHPGTPAAPIKNLRDAYPTIHRPAPSPTRPMPTVDRSSPSALPHDTAKAMRREALVRRLSLALAVVAVALALVALLSRM